jgi:hypothetical protein
VLALVLLAAAAIVKRHWWQAAWLLAAPVFIKIWPLAAAGLVVACCARPVWWRLGLAGGALAAVPFLTRLPATAAWQYGQWWTFLTGPCQARQGGYRDFWTIWEQFAEPHRGTFLVLQLGSLAALVAWSWWQGRRGASRRGQMTAILCGWAAWQLLFGPGTERLTYGLVAPFASWAVIVSFREARLRLLSASAWLLTVVLGAGFAERALLPYFWAAEAIQPLGVVLFAAWMVVYFHDRCEVQALALPLVGPPRQESLRAAA